MYNLLSSFVIGFFAVMKYSVDVFLDKNNETKEILVESPRRYDRDDDDDYDDRKERRRKKKSDRNEEEGSSIYSLIGGNKTKASS